MSEKGCPKCESGMIGTEIMYLVTGQVDGPRKEQEVHTCFGCGYKWAGEE